MRRLENLLVTGGAGFIGSAFIRSALNSSFQGRIVNLDLFTYAAHQSALEECRNHPCYREERGDINDTLLVSRLCIEERIDTIVHFAAETHVDRSIASAYPFLEANVKGTLSLLEAVRQSRNIHFHHVSTDEVYGSLGQEGFFNETSSYQPNSPYSASKAASDHFVRAYAKTFALSTTISHCSNNYGPFQNSEKFIPLMISHCLAKKPLPVYGKGANIRDWLYVEDHVDAIWKILERGQSGETYDIGANQERTNLELLHLLIDLLSEETGEKKAEYLRLIRYVADRPGHDFRYAIDCSKIERELGWRPTVDLSSGLRKTIHWHCSQKKLQSAAMTAD